MDIFNIINHQTKPEIKLLIYDIFRTITIQVITQFFFSMNNSSVSFMSDVFVQTTLFLCVGIIAFWLIVYKIVANNIYFDLFDTKINDKKDIKE